MDQAEIPIGVTLERPDDGVEDHDGPLDHGNCLGQLAVAIENERLPMQARNQLEVWEVRDLNRLLADSGVTSNRVEHSELEIGSAARVVVHNPPSSVVGGN